MKLAVVCLCLILSACQHAPERAGTEVDFVNASRATRCAEEDNVYVQVAGDHIGRFRIRAQHPHYIGTVREDSTAPDFTDCDMSGDPRYAAEPRTVVLHDDGDTKLVGHAFESFWRPATAVVRVLDRQEPGLHLIQLIRRLGGAEVEQLVLYPPDGYWRLKPMPPRSLPDSAYGSSFLFGPIEEDGRPYVAMREIEFDPLRLRFRIVFADGRIGTLRVARTGRDASVLDLALTPPLPSGRPFAALRSMFVTETNADVAIASWPDGSGAATTRPILDFDRFRAPSATFGRQTPSRHNLSAPDFVFGDFERTEPRPSRAAAQP